MIPRFSLGLCMSSHLLSLLERTQCCFNYPVLDTSGDGVLFSIDFFIYIFVSLLARLRENGRADLHEIFREGVE